MDTFGLFAFAFSDCFPFTGGSLLLARKITLPLFFYAQNQEIY